MESKRVSTSETCLGSQVGNIESWSRIQPKVSFVRETFEEVDGEAMRRFMAERAFRRTRGLVWRVSLRMV